MSDLITEKDFRDFLAKKGILVKGEIFIYKSGLIAPYYVNMDALSDMGAVVISGCLRGMVDKAIKNGLTFKDDVKNVLIIGPAYGASLYALIVAEYLSKHFKNITFKTANTHLDENGRHYIVESLSNFTFKSDEQIIVEDIVIKGNTIKEIAHLLSKRLHSTLSLIDVGQNSAQQLDIGNFYPFLSLDVGLSDPRVDSSLFLSGMTINTTLGSGVKWIDIFGHPPYSNINFGTFPAFR